MTATQKSVVRAPIKQIDREAFETELARCVAGEGECKRNWDALDHDAGAWQGVTDWVMEYAILITDEAAEFGDARPHPAQQ